MPEPSPNKGSADEHVISLTTRVQQIMTILKASQTKDERFTAVMKAVYGSSCFRNIRSTLCIYQHT
jgi:hypothetical protein